MEISIVIPAYNEAESLPLLIKETSDAVARLPVREILVVDDSSNDNTQTVLNGLAREYPLLRVLRHTRRSGQSTALWTGVRRARGDLIVTMDGDGQNDPADIAQLFAQYENHANNNPRTLVAGQRRKRHDNTVRRLSSRVANGVRSAVLRDGVRDTGCSLKLFRKNDFLDIPFFNHLHRFIPAMMKAQGAQIVLVDVGHRPRMRGVSKYGMWDRLWVGIADLFGVRWLTTRLKPATDVIEPES
jgi:dolichol-phosphate mannosyltransferase